MPKFKYVVVTKRTEIYHLDYEFEHNNPNLSHEEIMDILREDCIVGTPVPEDYDCVLTEDISQLSITPVK